jgi:hypothetical protein
MCSTVGDMNTCTFDHVCQSLMVTVDKPLMAYQPLWSEAKALS